MNSPTARTTMRDRQSFCRRKKGGHKVKCLIVRNWYRIHMGYRLLFKNTYNQIIIERIETENPFHWNITLYCLSHTWSIFRCFLFFLFFLAPVRPLSFPRNCEKRHSISFNQMYPVCSYCLSFNLYFKCTPSNCLFSCETVLKNHQR